MGGMVCQVICSGIASILFKWIYRQDAGSTFIVRGIALVFNVLQLYLNNS
jgi:hypothetical protein